MVWRYLATLKVSFKSKQRRQEKLGSLPSNFIELLCLNKGCSEFFLTTHYWRPAALSWAGAGKVLIYCVSLVQCLAHHLPHHHCLLLIIFRFKTLKASARLSHCKLSGMIFAGNNLWEDYWSESIVVSCCRVISDQTSDLIKTDGCMTMQSVQSSRPTSPVDTSAENNLLFMKKTH